MARIIEQAKNLPARERREVVSALEASLAGRSRAATARNASRGPSYEQLLALAGTAHARASNISADKYAHLAAAYGDDEA